MLAFSINNYVLNFRIKQSVELFCAYVLQFSNIYQRDKEIAYLLHGTPANTMFAGVFKMIVMFPKVVQVIPMKDYYVYVYFDDGKIVCYDMNEMIEKEVFRPLKELQVFMETCTVMDDTLAWDICMNRDFLCIFK